MRFFRKHLFTTAVFILSAFFSLLAVEAAHHHGAAEETHACSFCSWQLASPNLTAFVPPFLDFVPLFFAVLLSVETPAFAPFFLSIPGRSPPPNLL